jgi:flavin-binding protein dodecin
LKLNAFAPSRPAERPASWIHGGPRLVARQQQAEEEVPMGVIIIREMVGTSPRSWSDAARQAVATASKTVRNIQTVEVVTSTAVVRDGEIVEYRVDLKIGFEYEG